MYLFKGTRYSMVSKRVWLQGDNKSIPDVSTWELSQASKYVHYCDNETIQGVEFMGAPDVGDKLLCGDFSSDFLSKPIDVSKYAVVYGGASYVPVCCTSAR
jgi:phosphoserine aminotransferase